MWRRTLFVFGFSAFAAAAFAQDTLNLKASLERAYANNPRLLSAQKDLSIAQTQIREAKSLFYPKVNLNLNYIRYRNETLGLVPDESGGTVLEAPLPNSAGVRAEPLADNLYLGRLLFRQTLYSGGKIRNTYKLSQANLRRAESGYETLKHEIEYETAKNYFELLALKKKEAVLSNALVELDKAARQTGNEHESLKVSQMAADVRERLSQLKSDREQTRYRYLQSMGMELFGAADVDGELDIAGAPEELQQALVLAKQNRTDLKATEIQEEVDQLSVELSRAERYPVFLLGGGYEVRNNEFPVNETNWHAALSMNIPVFDGFSGYARVKESRYRAEQGRLKRVNLEDQVEGDVRSAYSEVTHWKQEMDARQLTVTSFNKLRPHYFGAGRANKTRSERLDFLFWDINAQCNSIDARCQYAKARARLAQATGRSLTDQL